MPFYVDPEGEIDPFEETNTSYPLPVLPDET